MRAISLVSLLVSVVSCKVDHTDTASQLQADTFSYRLELKGKGFLGSVGGATGHKALGVLGCMTTTVTLKDNGYLITGDATRKAKSPSNDEVWVVQVNDTLRIDVDKNFRPQDNHNQFSLLRYFVHLARTQTGNKDMTFGYDMDFGGKITPVNGRINKVKNKKGNLRYEMKGSFTKVDNKQREFDLGYTEHGADGEIVKAEIVIPKEIIKEKSDVGVVLTPTTSCQVNGAHGQRWNFENPVISGQG